MQREDNVLVVGGINIDIGGIPYAPLVEHDSNPGRVQISLGGVGRNIAHNMSLLGMKVKMITAFGDDAFTGEMVGSCADIGIDITHALQVKGGRSSTYLFIADENGEMELGLIDTELYDHLTPEYFESKRGVFDAADLVVADTNISEEALIKLADLCKAPLFVDPVSTAKAPKLRGILGKIHTLKPNLIEAEVLSGIHVTDEKSLELCVSTLLDTGIQRVFVSMGAYGVYAADRSGDRCRLPCFEAHKVNTTGCGDAFMAALVWSYTHGLDLESSAKAGLAASAIAMEDRAAINPRLTAEAMCGRAGISN